MSVQKASVFISYSWNESDEVDLIEKEFQKVGINITRDVNDIKYKDDLRTFMKSVRQHDYCLILLSDSYLKSTNCLIELIEFSKENDFENRLLPIYHEVDIFKPLNRIEYIKYWEEYSEDSQENLKSLNPIKYTNEIKSVQEIEFISLNISDFLESIKKLKILSFSECKETNFRAIFDFLNIDENQISSRILELDKITDIEKREAKLEELFLEYPKNDLIIFYKGCMASVERNNPAQSIILFEKYLKNNPNDTLALNNLAFQYNKIEKPKKALNLMSKALEIDPESTELNKNMGILLFYISKKNPRLKDFKSSVSYLEKAAKSKPDDYNIFYKLGEVYLQGLLDFDKALNSYQKSLELKPDQLTPYTHSVAILTVKERYEEARIIIQNAKKYNPNDEKLICSEAILNIESGNKINEGLDTLKYLTTEFPKFFMPYIQLSKYLVELYEDYNGAISILLRGKKIVDEENYLELFLANLIEQKGNKKSKEKELYTKLVECLNNENYSSADKIIKNHEEELEGKHNAVIYAIYNNWGLQLLDLANNETGSQQINILKKACEKFRKATEYYSDQFHAWGNWGSTLGRLTQLSQKKITEEDLEEVFKKFDKATQLNPDVFELWLDWGIYLSIYSDLKSNDNEELKYLEESCEKIERAVDLNPSNYKAFIYWGKIKGTMAYVINSEEKSPLLYKSAIDKLNRSIELQPDNYHAWGLLGLGNRDLAEMIVEKSKTEAFKFYKTAIDAFTKAYELSLDDDFKIEIFYSLFKASLISKGKTEKNKLKKRSLAILKQLIKKEKLIDNVKSNSNWDDVKHDEDVKELLKN